MGFKPPQKTDYLGTSSLILSLPTSNLDILDHYYIVYILIFNFDSSKQSKTVNKKTIGCANKKKHDTIQ